MSINPATLQLLVWIIIGAVAGTLTSMIFYRRSGPIADLSTLGLGLMGALVGRILFDIFRVTLSMPALIISVDDLVAAIIGSLIVLFFIRSQSTRRK
jgi:uncharacterized membrane protein YeaQ/YmgE (transglycosylase-associated protein family)